jgi:hypothetical protein
MDIDVVRNGKPVHFPEEMGAAVDHLAGNDAIFQDELAVIDILEEKIEGFQALADTSFDIAPFGGRDDPGNNVEREDLFDSLAAAVYGKGDALAHEEAFGELFFFAQLFDAHLLEKAYHALVLLADSA